MNTPATKQQVEELKSGQIIAPEYPNRKTRRSLDKVPRSTKIAKSSANNPRVIRTNKQSIKFKKK